MKKGDLISVLDETTTGKIISVSKDFALIEDEFGFEHSIEISKIIPRESHLYEKSAISIKDDLKKKASKKNSDNSRVIDLHFEKLVKNPAEYSAWERLEIQKETLIENLDYCKKNYIKKLNIIHGIGDGVLQNLVYDYLRGYSGIQYEEDDFFFHSSGNVWVTFN
ncbi:Smr domain-containing protein [Halpernia humi]|uniref:Smr domain-containing protein n=1 Tax=Halpernia humi TaxID=493375 RepID=A0A1H5UBX0_9FLAO|nr:Smr/MutS family protein [Halpernia humi]SEF72540.1 Smr domain-containing protein [Halpernia humi]